MFRRYPYWGWLVLSLLLWCINGYNYHLHRQDVLPERMAQAVNSDLRHREDVFESFMHERDLVRRLFTDSLTEKESEKINNFPFYVYAYDKDSLKFWNTGIFTPAYNDSLLGKTMLLRNENGVFVARCMPQPAEGPTKRLVVLFPVFISYPLENDYLKTHFSASGNIPITTKILSPSSPHSGAYPVSMHGNNVVFYLQFNPADVQKWIPTTLFILMLLAALIVSISWLQLMVIHLTRNKSSVTGLIITLSLVAVFRSLLYIYGLPFNLDTLNFFSPSLYASSKFLSSFGDLFINTLCVLWIIVFITRHTPYKNYFDGLKIKPLRYIAAAILICLLFVYMNFFVGLVRSLVLDSSISFDVSHFYAINIYTVLGLLVIGGMTGISCLIIYLFNIQFNALIKNNWVKFLLIAVAGIILLNVGGKLHDPFYGSLAMWLLIFIVMLDIPGFTLVSDLFEPHMISWAVFICVFCTGIVQYFNEIKERDGRRAYVELKYSPHRDNLMEYDFDKKANAIEHDKALKTFFNKPSANGRKNITERFNALYFTGSVNKYQSWLYLFDANGKELFNKDTLSYATLQGKKNESWSTNSSYLFYMEDLHDRHFYYAYIPIYADSINKRVGFVVIDLDTKKPITETAVYPELLKTNTNKTNQQENEYSVGVYMDGRLVSQTKDYPFTTILKNDNLKEQDYAFLENNNVSELRYKIEDKRVIVVAHEHNRSLEMITLFSYIFVIQVLIALFIVVYQLYLSYFTEAISPGIFLKLTLGKRVRYSMLAIVLISFIVVCSVTIWFFQNQYKLSNINKLQSGMQIARQSVDDELKQVSAYSSPARFDSICRSNWFKDYVVRTANRQKIDINIFQDRGALLSSSQEEIYDKGLVSRVMRPAALYQLSKMGKSIVVLNERVAALSYLSAYEPLTDETGKTMGYINVPFFSSEKDLNLQISNIVVTLINLYAFIFLISSVMTVFITRWITRTFNMIIKQFGRINLQRNERIQWPYDDEIGLLVTEYNKMVNKVEENAARLAQSERESAWREMARQVAHEIKNPLTPMKLNIQYLQQAMKNDAANIKELTDKVANSIVEQIDNLSYIASEFSNFATMPEARPEKLELGELLHKAVELHLDDARVKVTILDVPQQLFVHSDRSQLLRVFTNLLENARQAIPADRNGNISVSLTAENNEVTISIADNGAGIPEEIVAKMFQPYFTTKSSGTGLGLAMTKKIIEFWKGTIWFETEEGVGTTFYIRLPLNP
jgi:signal transduction histidine kinase